MKRIAILTMAIAAFALISCHRNDGGGEDGFEFSVSAEASDDTAPVVVSVDIEKGGYDGYVFRGSVYEFVSDGMAYPAKAEFYSDDELVMYGQELSFPNSGHRDFRINGLPAKTYRITIELSKDGKSVSHSCLAVVQKSTGGGGGDGGGDDDTLIEWFTVPEPKNGYNFHEAVNIVLSLYDYYENNPFVFMSVVYPSTASSYQLVANSSNAAVLSAYVEGDRAITLVPKTTGLVVVTVNASKGPAKGEFSVKVTPKSWQPETVPVSDFTLPGLDANYQRFCMQASESFSFTPSIVPENASDKTFSVRSADESVVKVESVDGKITITGVYPGKTSVTITSDGGNGITKTLPVLIYKNVNVKIEFEETTPTDAQIKTKTFPCKLKFSSDSDVAFLSPIIWTISMKSIINSPGKDSQTVSDKTDVQFYGNRIAYYNIMEKILLPSYLVYRTTDYSYSLTLELVREASLDKDLWRLSYDEAFKTQEARIKEYITQILQ